MVFINSIWPITVAFDSVLHFIYFRCIRLWTLWDFNQKSHENSTLFIIFRRKKFVSAGTYPFVILTLRNCLKPELATFCNSISRRTKVHFFNVRLNQKPSACTTVCHSKIFAFVSCVRILIDR